MISLADLELLGALFCASGLMWAGAAKLMRPTETAVALKNFRLTRTIDVRAAVVAAVAEASAGILLSLAALGMSVWLPVATFLGIGLYAFFVVLVSSGLRRGESFACMCFGSSVTRLSPIVLVRAGLFLVVAVATFAFSFSTSVDSVAWSSKLFMLCSVAGVLGTVSLVSSMRATARRIDPFAALSNQLVLPTNEGGYGS